MPVTGWPITLSEKHFQTLDAAPPSENARSGFDLLAETESFWEVTADTAEVPGKGWKVTAATGTVLVVTTGTWMLKSVKADPKQLPVTLQHEQVHHDLAGLAASDKLAAVLKLSAPTQAALNKLVEDEDARVVARLDVLNAEFDKQTTTTGTPADQLKRQALWVSAVATAKANAGKPFAAPP